MRAVVQRVKAGKVSVGGKVAGEIGKGLVVLVGISKADDAKDVEYLADKIANLRIFDDSEGKLNLSVLDTGREILAVSQFTLYADCRKGRRPGFNGAASPDVAEELYGKFLECLREYGLRVETGRFQARMMVDISNDGPVTILLDSKKAF